MATFAMNLDQLEGTLLKIEEYLDGADEKTKFKAMFICEELLTNLVRHADFEGRTPSITIEIETDKKSGFIMEYRDNSKAFNLQDHKDPNIDAQIQERELGGLGIYLVKKYAPNLEYKQEGGFNVLRLSL
ncbi:MAG: ATP-binding protein [Sulfurimonas sp.]|uniref:ATP-binding protein n=1 Tax=Sulfurimonas sp. TaxID=2022749 RepID=UPI0025DFEDA5|nr:ATP-binding protein [Sulfurimonas sp.]MCK9490619.1 ATP-binding protein [Sulfurimonas sp.]